MLDWSSKCLRCQFLLWPTATSCGDLGCSNIEVEHLRIEARKLADVYGPKTAPPRRGPFSQSMEKCWLEIFAGPYASSQPRFHRLFQGPNHWQLGPAHSILVREQWNLGKRHTEKVLRVAILLRTKTTFSLLLSAIFVHLARTNFFGLGKAAEIVGLGP